VSHEQVFTLEATPLKYGRGAAGDAGWELERLGVTKAMLVSDPGVVAAGITDRVRQAIEASGIDVEVWSSARVEPTADSFATMEDMSQSGVARLGSTSAWMRKRAACAAMPAARSSTSTEVAVKKWRSGMRSRPLKRNQPTATPPTRPMAPPAIIAPCEASPEIATP